MSKGSYGDYDIQVKDVTRQLYEKIRLPDIPIGRLATIQIHSDELGVPKPFI